MYQEIIHRSCGGIAFLYIGGAVAGERIRRERARLPNGAIIPKGEAARCGFCGELLNAGDIAPGLCVYDATDDEDMAVLYG